MQLALVSREVAPFGGSGIGEYVDTTARLLARLGHVTIFTTDAHRDAYEALVAAGDPGGRLAPEARYCFVEEPEHAHGFYSPLHAYHARVLDAVAEHFPGGGPELVEVSDFLGEGFALAQARATNDPRLARAVLAVRLHTTAELCAVLDGHFDATDFETRVATDMERYSLRHADVLLWPGGDVLGLYRRFYGTGHLAPARLIRNPLRRDGPLGADSAPAAQDGPLKLLYLGRLERRKGVQNLLRAVTALKDPEWRLTLVGADTATGPLGGSMQAQLELMAGRDPRIEFVTEVPRHALGDVVAAHDVVVLPSLWECWPYVALEAMRRNRPVLATPTGGFVELIRPGVNGWLTANTGADALEEALAGLLADREGIAELRRRHGPQATVARLADADEVVDGYRALLGPRRMKEPRRTSPLVSVIVPYHRMAAFVEDTIRSIVAQTYPTIEIIVVDDGSFEPEDMILAELSARYPLTVLAQPNAGLGAARNFGISQARGRYILPLDADNTIVPTFVERCVDVLEREPRVAFVTAWSLYVDEDGAPFEPPVGYQPLGNESELIARDNVAGDAAAVLRRRIFDLGFRYSQDLTSFEDWHLYLELHRAGHDGLVIPERLLHYRVRGDSMIREVGLQRTQRLFGEIQAHVRENEVTWVSRSA